MNAFQRFTQGVAFQSTFQPHNVVVPAGLEQCNRTVMYAFEQENTDLVLGERQVRACAHLE